jgi:hypothetical protein
VASLQHSDGSLKTPRNYCLQILSTSSRGLNSASVCISIQFSVCMYQHSIQRLYISALNSVSVSAHKSMSVYISTQFSYIFRRVRKVAKSDY